MGVENVTKLLKDNLSIVLASLMLLTANDVFAPEENKDKFSDYKSNTVVGDPLSLEKIEAEKRAEHAKDSAFFTSYVNRRIKSEGLEGILDGDHKVYIHRYRKVYPTKPSASVVDKDGRLIYDLNGDQPAQIASLSKIIGMYQVFSELKEGNVKLGDKIKISANAENQYISTRYMYRSRPKRGEEYTVEQAIKGAWGVSSNSFIVGLGEHLYGSEKSFVHEINKIVGEMGFDKGRLYNATGLNVKKPYNKFPASATATIYNALILDFPEYAHLVGVSSYTSPKRKKEVKHPAAYELREHIDHRYSNKTGHYSKTGWWHSFVRELDDTPDIRRKYKETYAAVFGGVTKKERTLLTDIFNDGLNELALRKKPIIPLEMKPIKPMFVDDIQPVLLDTTLVKQMQQSYKPKKKKTLFQRLGF